jgi:type II secretory pathway component PulM
MNEVYKYLDLLRQWFWRVVERIEESSYFERLVHTYETLEPRQQKWIRFLGKAAFVGLLVMLVFQPLWNTWTERRDLQKYRRLVQDASLFQYQVRQLKQGYQRPRGWQPLPAGNTEQVNESLAQYLSNIGVSPDFYRIEAQENALNMEVDELSIKQANALLYQVEGFYPLLSFTNLQMKVHPENKTLLKMSALIQFNAQYAGQFGGDGGGAMPSDFGGVAVPPAMDDGEEFGSPPPTPSPGRGARPSRPSPQPEVPDVALPTPRPNEGTNPNFDAPPSAVPGFPGQDGEALPGAGRGDGTEEFYPPEFTPPPEYIEEDI